MIDTIIFDLGGVLIEWDPKRLYRKIFHTEKEVDHFLQSVCTMDWNEEQDGGRTWEEGIQKLVPIFPQYEKEIRAYFERWEEMLGNEVQGSVDILKYFVKNPQYRVVALTNWSAETFPIALKRFEFLNWFEKILVSGAVHLKKPDPRIYQLLLKDFSINPSKALFIDDNLRNVKAARKEGIASIHFESPQQLKEQLKSFGIDFEN